MRFLARNRLLKHISTFYCVHPTSSSTQYHQNAVIRHNLCLPNPRQVLKPLKVLSVSCALLSDDKKHFIDFEKKAEALKDVLHHKKEQLKDTEHRIRQRGEELVRDIKHQKEVTEKKLRVKKEHLIKDILETKAKVKERFEEVVEVHYLLNLFVFYNKIHYLEPHNIQPYRVMKSRHNRIVYCPCHTLLKLVVLLFIETFKVIQN